MPILRNIFLQRGAFLFKSTNEKVSCLGFILSSSHGYDKPRKSDPSCLVIVGILMQIFTKFDNL